VVHPLKRLRLLPLSQIPKNQNEDSRVEEALNGITISKEEMTIIKRINRGVMRHPRDIVLTGSLKTIGV